MGASGKGLSCLFLIDTDGYRQQEVTFKMVYISDHHSLMTDLTDSLVRSPQEADLVTTHELGHNFGAEHDPDDMPDCAPREDQGGKYVMYPIAVSGDHINNKVMSTHPVGGGCGVDKTSEEETTMTGSFSCLSAVNPC